MPHRPEKQPDNLRLRRATFEILSNVLRSSTDLTYWGDKKVVFVDPSKGTWAGPTESLTVIQRGKFYYLFIGPRDDYRCTAVYRSADPFQWTPADEIARINSPGDSVAKNDVLYSPISTREF